MIKKGTRYPEKLAKGDRNLDLLLRGTRPIWVSKPAAHAAKKAWLSENVEMVAMTADDSTAKWFEVAITLPGDFTGSPETGWTNGTIDLGLIYTLDLINREVVDWITTPGSSVETLGDGRKRHFARCSIPVWWLETMLDLTLTCARQGKAITSVLVFGVPVSLSGYPYAMPADASRLQADLRTAGYTGATVTSTAASYSIYARNFQAGGGRILTATFSGDNVTAMAEGSTSISLPGYPYAMPGDRADLQADLRTAGYDGAVILLYDDPWTILLPDLISSDNERRFSVQFTPGDPFPVWDFHGDYVGENPADTETGGATNVRAPGGSPLREETARGFAAMRITNEPPLP